jgi:hypothetical protein
MGELLILACHGIEGSAATLAYMRRWNIETGFEKLKSHGVRNLFQYGVRFHAGNDLVVCVPPSFLLTK